MVDVTDGAWEVVAGAVAVAEAEARAMAAWVAGGGVVLAIRTEPLG